MSHTTLFQNPMSFQRLEDFSSYTSCIKFFGKPIIPPLVTTERREEICTLRASAIEKETEILRRESYSHSSKKVKEIFHMVAEHLASSTISNDLMIDGGDTRHNVSALHSFSMNGLISSPSADIRSFENSMHMSMTKIPSSDICSTVHTGVIVCPNIYSRKHENSRRIEAKSFSRPVPPNEFCFHMANPECSLCQTEHPHGPFPLGGVPYINSPAERICSVSDEEQGSVAEETDFESLVTVVSGRKFIAQDTDNESNFTCLTQSTDLEKYMDCSIEYSSPDDGASLTKSQMSNQLNISSRSDDASSETLVNTESELTPCASALSELNGYINENNSGNSNTKREVSSTTAFTSSDIQQRAHSVDSYMKIIKTSARNLFMRKSQSEPSHSDMSNFSNNFSSPTSSCGEGNGKPANLKIEICADTFKTSKDSEHLQITNTEFSSDNIGDPSSEQKKVFKKGHIRTNSYTLDEPSSALIMAHADCTCKGDSETIMSPHSCASEKMISPTLNPAFKKEKVNIVLPPTPDRDKYFPILSSSTCYQEKNSETELEAPSLDTTVSEAYTKDNSLSNATNMNDKNKRGEETSEANIAESESLIDDTPSQSTTDAADEVNLEQVEISLEEEKKDSISTTGIEPAQLNEQNIVMSSSSQSQLKGDDLQVYLNEMILEIQEKQQTRVQKLFEEQNKQWLQLQEEFKEQEKLLCAKLNLFSMPSASDNVLENKPPSVSGDKNKWNAAESMPSNFQICPDMKSLYNLNIRNIDYKESLTTAQNYSNASEMSLKKDPENEVSNEGKDSVKDNLSNSFMQYSSISRDSVTPPDKNVANTSKPSSIADKPNLNVNFSDDSLERPQTVHSTISSRSASNLKSQSFNDTASQCNSVRSENFAISLPCSHSLFQMNDTYPDVIQTVNYQPTSSMSSSSLTNNVTENIQNSAYKNLESLRSEAGYGADYLLKDKVGDAPIKWFGGAYPSVAVPTSSNLATYAYSHSEMQLFTDKTNQENCYTAPNSPEERKTDEILPPTYHPSLHCDNMAMNEMGKYSQNLFACKHVSGRENFEESVFTSLGNCTSMALPITSNSEAFRHFETNLTCNHDNAFKEPATNFETSHFGDATNFNPKEKFEANTDASLRQQWYHVPNDILNASLKNKIQDHNHATHQNSTVIDSNVHCPSNMQRKVFSKHHLNIPMKSQSDSSISQNVHKISVNAVPTTQSKAQKQIFSSSLTNLKRRQSKDFIRDPNLLKKFEKLPAFVKGYLTRRLFKTERVQGLIKTLQDTALLIGKLGEELTLKGDAVSEHDVDFHRQLIVQLMTTFHSVYDIFCTISVKERMKIISESRSLEQKKKAAERSKDSPSPVIAEKTVAPVPARRSKLSAATLKALERKKRSTIDNRTYTVEDLKGCRARIHSSTSSKSHSSSPSRLYKSSIGLALKRKTSNVRKTQHWK